MAQASTPTLSESLPRLAAGRGSCGAAGRRRCKALDSANGIQIMSLLGRLRGQRHMTILLVTDDLPHRGTADRTLRMRDGRPEVELGVA
jgi:hypothetical protein